MCGVLGYCATKWDPALEKFFGLQGFNLQHRGQENFGCTYSNGHKFDHFKDEIVTAEDFIDRCASRSEMTGKPYQEILKAADARGATLIVMGIHGSNPIERLFVGSTALQVLRGARCPVLTVRSAEGEAK